MTLAAASLLAVMARLTLTFREAEAGVFAAHSYKFNKRTSTFIVECDEETWNQAGFDKMSEDETRAGAR